MRIADLCRYSYHNVQPNSGMEKMNWTGNSIFLAYIVLFIGAFFGVAVWDRRKRRTQKPFGENVRLLRMPGERLWRQVIEKDATELQWTIGLMLVPIFAVCFSLQIVPYFFGKTYISLVIAIAVFVFVMLLCVRSLVERLKDRENRYLGF